MMSRRDENFSKNLVQIGKNKLDLFILSKLSTNLDEGPKVLRSTFKYDEINILCSKFKFFLAFLKASEYSTSSEPRNISLTKI